MPDSEHRVVYKAFADFTALYAEVAKAKAAMAALKKETGGAASTDRSKDIGQQRELSKVTREHVAAAEADTAAVKRQAALYQQLSLISRKAAQEMSAAENERRKSGEIYQTVRASQLRPGDIVRSFAQPLIGHGQVTGAPQLSQNGFVDVPMQGAGWQDLRKQGNDLVEIVRRAADRFPVQGDRRSVVQAPGHVQETLFPRDAVDPKQIAARTESADVVAAILNGLRAEIHRQVTAGQQARTTDAQFGNPITQIGTPEPDDRKQNQGRRKPPWAGGREPYPWDAYFTRQAEARRRGPSDTGGTGPLALPEGPRTAAREARLAAEAARAATPSGTRAMPARLSGRDLIDLRRELRQSEAQMGDVLTRNTAESGTATSQWPPAERNMFRNLAAGINALRDEIASRAKDRPDPVSRPLPEPQSSSSDGPSSSGAAGPNLGSLSDAETHSLLARILEAIRACCVGMGHAGTGAHTGGGRSAVGDAAASDAVDMSGASTKDIRRQTALTNLETAEERRGGASASRRGAEEKTRAASAVADAAEDRRRGTFAAADAAEERKKVAVEAALAAEQKTRTAIATAEVAENRKKATAAAAGVAEEVAQDRKKTAAAAAEAAENRKKTSAATAETAENRKRAAAAAAGVAEEIAQNRKKVTAEAAEAAENRKKISAEAVAAAESRKKAAASAADAAESRKRAASTAESIVGHRARQAAANADAAEVRLAATRARHGAVTGLQDLSTGLAGRIRQAAEETGHLEHGFVTLGDVGRGVWKGIAEGAEHAVSRVRGGFDGARAGASRAMTAVGDASRKTWIGVTQDIGGSTRKVGDFVKSLVSVRANMNRLGNVGDLIKFRAPVKPPAASGGGTAGGGGSGGDGGSGFLSAFAEAGNRAAQSLSGFIKHLGNMRTLIVAAVAAAGPLVAIIGALGAAALGAGNVMVSLAGTLAAVPGLFAAFGTGIGALVAAFGPLLSAFKAFQAYQQVTTAGSRQQAQAQVQAAQATRQAELNYVSSLKSVKDAQYDARHAQVDLNEARVTATRNLQDLRSELDRAALNEESATLAVKQAMADYRKALADPNATLLDRQEALNRVKQAEFDLGDVQQKNKRNQQDYNLAVKKGVNGSDEVVAAQKAISDAQFNVVQSQQRVIDATIALAQARKEEAAGGSQAYTAQLAYKDALDKLSPSARKVAEALFGLTGRWRGLQREVSEKLFAPVIGQLGKLPGLLTTVQKLLDSAAGAIGHVIAKGIAMVSSGPWKADFATLAKGNATLITRLGDAGLYVADAFRNITIAAQPFTTWLAGAVKGVAKQFDDWAKNARANGGIGSFLKETEARLKIVWDIVRNVLSFFTSLYGATKDIGDFTLSSLDKMSARWAEVGKAQEKHGSGLRKWLDDVKPLLSAIGHFIGEVAKAFAKLASDPRNIAEAKNILGILATDILPKLVAIFGKVSEHGIVGEILKAVGNGLDAINAALDRTKGLPLDIIVGFLQAVGIFLKWAFQNPIVGSIIAAWAIALATFIGTAALGKLTGLFKLWEFLRWIIANKGAFGSGLLDKIFGTEPGAAAGKKAANKYNEDVGKPKGTAFGTYTPQLDTIIGLLEKIAECACSARGKVSPGGADGGTAKKTPGSAAGGAGVAGEEEAAGSLKGAAAALDGAAEALTGAAAALKGAAELTAGGDLLGVGGGKGKAAKKAAGAAEKEVAGLAEKDAAKGGGGVFGWLKRLFTSGGAKGAEAGVEKVAGKGILKGAGRLLGAADPLTWVGLGLGVAADSGLLGKRGSTTKQFAQAGGAVLTGAGIGAGIGSVVPVVGTAVGAGVGALAGLAYSLWKDKGLREKLGHFFESIGTWFADLGKSAGPWINTHVIKPVVGFFSGIGKAIGRQVTGPVKWIYDHILTPVGHFFAGIGKAIAGGATTAAKFVWEKFIHPILAIFIGIGLLLFAAGAVISKSLYHGIIKPIGDFFAWIGKSVAGIYTTGRKWVEEHLSKPIFGFLSWVGRSVAALYNTVRKWVADHISTPLFNLFSGLGRGVVAAYNTARTWVADHISKPVFGFFSGLGKGIVALYNTARTWVADHISKPVFGFFKTIGDFFVNLPSNLEKWLEGIPGIGPIFKKAFDILPGAKHASGGLVEGTNDGRVDTKHVWLTPGEWLTRKRVVDKPGGKQILSALNNEQIDPQHLLALVSSLGTGKSAGRWMDPSMLYSALGAVTAPARTTPPAPTARPVSGAHVVHDNSKHTGLSTGDITINNPVREPASRSLRRTLHASAYLHGR